MQLSNKKNLNRISLENRKKRIKSAIAFVLAISFLIALPFFLIDALHKEEIAEPRAVLSEEEFELFAKVISAEARGEPYTGQVAVGAVILNRLDDPDFPNTLTEVVYQKNQFSCMDDGQIDQPLYQESIKAAQDALNGMDPTNGCLYYYNPQTATNSWNFDLVTVYSVGKHVFSKGMDEGTVQELV